MLHSVDFFHTDHRTGTQTFNLREMISCRASFALRGTKKESKQYAKLKTLILEKLNNLPLAPVKPSYVSDSIINMQFRFSELNDDPRQSEL